jgi:subtilase family serine protease
LGNTISNSWSLIDGQANPAQLNRIERILQQAAAQGIDLTFATGDSGDEAPRVGKRDYRPVRLSLPESAVRVWRS